MLIARIKERKKDLRLLQDIVLDVFLLATVLEHLRQTFRASHSTTKTCSDLRGMHVVVQLVGIGDTGLIERLRRAD